MALEKIHGTQIVTWAPPLPQRAFRITAAGVTSDSTNLGGLATDGTRYGYYVLDTSKWGVQEGFHQPPVQAGEKFQLWTAQSGGTFHYPPPANDVSAGSNWNSYNYAIATSSPDLFNVYPLTQTREMGNNSGNPIYVIKNSQVCTVVAAQQSSNGSWYVYFAPALDNSTVSASGSDGIITLPRPYNPKYLGQVGHVSAINYTYTIPGGPNQLTCLLQVEPNFRTDAINPGRIVTAHRGASCIWEGQLTEPVPATTGWTLTANGVGTYGANFAAWYGSDMGPTKNSNGWTPDAPVDLAIARGLRWTNRGIGNPSGIYTGPLQNPGSLSITDFMNLLGTGGSLFWELVQPSGAASWPPAPWEVTVYEMPTDQDGNPLLAGPSTKTQVNLLAGGKWKRTDLLTSSGRRPPDLFLINTSPVARSIVADYNTIILYYQVTPDKTATSTTSTATAATYSTTFVDAPASVAAHGRMEYYLDISNAGPMSATAAQAIGLNVLTKYIRANFGGSFSVMPGQLVNPGGFPVDLGLNWNGAVVTVQGVNAAQGGEVGLSPLTFIIGQYQFDDDTQTATVTPYQNVLTDMASVVAALYPGKFSLVSLIIYGTIMGMGAPQKYPNPEAGTKFGYGTVTALASFKRKPERKNWERGAVMQCECGTEYLVDLAALYSGSRKSCGCKRKKRGIVATPGYAQHPLYFTWHGMIDRCYNPDVINYHLYGGRGVTVCEEWRGPNGMMNFAAYIERELGPRPARCTLDRYDPTGNYEPGNVRWASGYIQARNRRSSELDQKAVRQWAREHQLPVEPKGKLPLWALEAYKAAHPR